MALFLSVSSFKSVLNSSSSALRFNAMISFSKCFKDSESSGPAMLIMSFISLNSFSNFISGSTTDFKSFNDLMAFLD